MTCKHLILGVYGADVTENGIVGYSPNLFKIKVTFYVLFMPTFISNGNSFKDW